MQAREILQDYLDRVGMAVVQDDWARYRADVALPFHIVTGRATITVATEEELRRGYDAFIDMFRTLRVTDYVRLVSHATMIDEGLVGGEYLTHALSGAVRVVPAFVSQVTLRRGRDGVWRAAAITDGMLAAQWPIHSLLMPNRGPD